MPTIDIALPDDLQQVLKQPVCLVLPKPGKVKITLPSGPKFSGIADITKQIPDDCSLSFSLVLQLAPFLANLDCLLKILKVLQPLIELVTALKDADPVKIPEAAKKLGEAVPPLITCITDFFGAIPAFIRDLLCLMIKLLRCVIGGLKSVLAVMSGLSLQITSAQSAGNTELLATLECAQKNAAASAQGMMVGVEPVLMLLALAEPLFGLAGVDPITTPALGSPEDLASLQSTIDTLDQLVKTLQLVADALGGCNG